MRLQAFLTAVTAAVSLAGCAIPVAAPSPAASPPRVAGAYTTAEARIFDLINAERQRHGLPALVFNDKLDQMAKIQATNMAYFQKMAHTIPEARLPALKDRATNVGYGYREIAENVALGYPSAESVVRGWMNSTGHRRNILNAGVVETGIGIARSSAGGIYYCQVFGRQLSSF